MYNVETKKKFIRDFINASNAASGSKVDANANVTTKTMAVMENELFKDYFIKLNRSLVKDTLTELFDSSVADQYEEDINSKLIYIHDETSLKPYCASITLYPFLLEGTKALGGTSKAPKNLQAFCGSFVNLIYQVASDFAGAVATVEFLMYFDYFARKTYGDYYIMTNREEVAQELQGVVYALNQPAGARGYQSVFWNISVFDENYFKSLFGEFYFPDGTQPDWKSLSQLQAYFLEWFRNERTKELLSFPVVTAAYLTDKESKLPLDTKFTYMLAEEMSKGLSFFHYQSDSADSLASCCRLRNELQDNTFSYSLGAGGVSTGSFQVITINLNRFVQMDTKLTLQGLVARIHKYLTAHRKIAEGYIKAGMLPSYTGGFIDLSKQFGTIGINGALEAAEFVIAKCMKHGKYSQDLTPKALFKEWLGTIKALNATARIEYGYRFNTEFVPAENLGVKNAKWDREDGYVVPRDCYNSYFFAVENEDDTILDRLDAHGSDVSQYLDGGAACHLNLTQLPTADSAFLLIKAACQKGVPYWTTNVLCTICKDCGTIDPVTRYDCCHSCGSKNLDYGTRIIGYLRPISAFSEGRQKEAGIRSYRKVMNYV